MDEVSTFVRLNLRSVMNRLLLISSVSENTA